MGAHKLARYAYEKLQTLRIPSRFQEAVDVGSVMIRSKAFADSEVGKLSYPTESSPTMSYMYPSRLNHIGRNPTGPNHTGSNSIGASPIGPIPTGYNPTGTFSKGLNPTMLM